MRTIIDAALAWYHAQRGTRIGQVEAARALHAAIKEHLDGQAQDSNSASPTRMGLPALPQGEHTGDQP